MKKKLAVLGASYLQLPLILKAKSMGIETHCFAWDNKEAVAKLQTDFFYPISILDKEAILEVCREVKIDGILSIASDICVPTISFVAQEMGLPNNNSFENALKSTNKALMRQAFSLFGVLSPKSFAAKNYADIAEANLSFPLIVKPTDRSGSRGVALTHQPTELKKAIEDALSESIEKQVVIEEYIEGNEISVEAISYKGEHFILAITDKITTGPPYFVELEHHQPSALSEEQVRQVHQATFKALNALGVQFGASHSEFKLDQNGQIFVIEVGARMGGDFIGSHLVQLCTEYDFLKSIIDVAINNAFEPPVELKKHKTGVVFLCQENQKALSVFETPQQINKIVELERTSQDLKSVKSSADRCGYYIYCTKDSDL